MKLFFSFIYRLIIIGTFFVLSSCSSNSNNTFIEENVDFAMRQTQLMLKNAGAPNGENYPRTMSDTNTLLVTTDMYDWTSGFFPGSLWYLYELTGDKQMKKSAEEWTRSLEPLKTFKGHHDLGFMMYCSYGNAYRLDPKQEYADIIIESAKSLATRYSDSTHAIKSWDYRTNWNGKNEWFYPVIIDNMMNLELLFAASKLSGDKRYSEIAVEHANTTLKNAFRDDFSTFHVIDYDSITGEVKDKATCQGYSNNSTWSRGQAWAIYGYTMMYRETKDKKYLTTAVKAADYYLKYLPDDLVPVWDFNVGEAGYVPEGESYAVTFREKLKDASAAAVTCSAFFELDGYVPEKKYRDIATAMLKSLASKNYRAEIGLNADFILKHSVGSIPHRAEIDKPLVYADYYFLEALVRLKKLESKD